MTGRLPRCPRCLGHPGWAHDDESRRREPDDICRACLGSGVRRLSSGNRSPMLARLRDDDLADDPWGTAISWAFGVAEILTAAGAEVPAEMEYTPSPYVEFDIDRPADVYPDSEVWWMLKEETVTVADLQFAGRCLARYLDWLRAAGLDY